MSVVESDILSKTLGLALSQAETAETKQQAKVEALAAYERQRWLAEADACTRLFQDEALNPKPKAAPVPPPVTLSHATVLPAQVLTELEVCTHLFQDEALNPKPKAAPVPSPVTLSPAKALPAQALATPVHAGPDSASVPPTLAPTPAPTSPAKVLIAAQDPQVHAAVPPMPVSATPAQACVHCEAPSATIKPCSSCLTRRMVCSNCTT